MKLVAILVLALLATAGKSFGQEEFLDKPKEEVIQYFSANHFTYSIKQFRDTVYPAMKEKIIISNFKRWNTFGTLEIYVAQDGFVRSFEITFPPKGSKTILDAKNIELATTELSKKYGEVFFTHLDGGVSSYAWDTAGGEFNFLVYTKKHIWTFGFYPDTGD
ncbi:MAG: hypothetical protein Q8916_02520 [Bacteroidota bacterium]|nr:hypothetical protein [Bacteroidota bacterium]MDP4237114.1 hypothetical protein [Bacteroidota bacterium]